jgi:hypothetical protein
VYDLRILAGGVNETGLPGAPSAMFAGLRLVFSSRVLAAGLDDVIICFLSSSSLLFRRFGLPGDRPSKNCQIEFLTD